MQAFTAQQLQNARVEELTDIARMAPNLNVVVQNAMSQHIVIRGVGTNEFFGNAPSSVVLYMDEVTMNSSYMSTLGLFDMERIEVLRGPQSSPAGKRGLFGRLIQAAGPAAVVLAIQTLQPFAVTSAVVIAAGVIHPLMFGSESSFFAELFATRVRFTGISLGKQLGSILGGGLAPLVATALMVWSGGRIWAVVAYFGSLSVLGLIAAYVAGETRGREL